MHSDPELSEKFYWNLAAKLARRLQNLPKKTVNISNLLKSGEIPVEDEKVHNVIHTLA